MFDFLKKIPLFADLPDDDLNRLCEVVVEEIVLEDQILFSEGDPGDKAYVIMEGEVDILKESGDQTVLLATRKSGEVIGEMSLLDGKPRSANVVTLEDTSLRVIHRQEFENLLESHPKIALKLLRC